MGSAPEKLEIREAGLEQADLVWKIVSTSFEEYRNSEAPSSALLETVEHVKQALANGSEHAIICYFEGEPAGAVRFYMEEGLYFRRLGVLPGYRRKGISRALISWLEDHARKMGESRIWCYTRSSVERNMAMYRNMGYVLENERTVERNSYQVGVATFAKYLA